jgi:hypothetical protein
MRSPSASASAAPPPTADLRSAKASEPVIRRIWDRSWPSAVIGFGLAFTIIWIFFLRYGLVKIVAVAI